MQVIQQQLALLLTKPPHQVLLIFLGHFAQDGLQTIHVLADQLLSLDTDGADLEVLPQGLGWVGQVDLLEFVGYFCLHLIRYDYKPQGDGDNNQVINKIRQWRMSRQQMLYRLLEKAQKGNQYIYAQFCEFSQSCSPPATVKRMQLLQMGSGKINAPTPPVRPVTHYQKQSSSNNRRIFVMQRVKTVEKGRERQIGSCEGTLDKTTQLAGCGYECVPRTPESARKKVLSIQSYSERKQEARNLCLTQSLGKTPVDFNENESNYRSQKSGMYRSAEVKATQGNGSPMKFQSHRKFVNRNINTKAVANEEDTQSLNMKQFDKKSKILLRKQINKNYQRAYEPPPKISAKSFVVYQFLEQLDKQKKQVIKIHTAFNSKVKMQIASLTKIMTCILAIQLCERLKLSALGQQIKIGRFQSSISGTTAQIQFNDVYTLHDLLHGLMLPSGNDASLAIAVWAGKKLLEEKEKNQGELPRKKMKKQCYNRFIREMNTRSQELGMTKTTYANSHGLVNLLNRSCAHDIALLCNHCMKSSYFRSIVGCKQYHNKIKVQNKEKVAIVPQPAIAKPTPNKLNDQDQQISDMQSETCSNSSHSQAKPTIETPMVFQQKISITYRDVHWQNTHKLLHKNSQEYVGIKTGVTTAAGPCLSSCVQMSDGRKLFIVVLNCKKLQMRFKETEILKRWVYKRQGLSKNGLALQMGRSTKSQLNESDNQSEEAEEGENANQLYQD